MPTVQEVQEEGHTLWLCAGVFESTQQILYGFFLLTVFPLNLYIYIYIYILQNYSFYRHVTLRINELITNSSNFYIVTFFLCFCYFHIFIVVSVCFCNDAYLYNEMIFIEINFSCKIIIICLTCWFYLEWVVVDK